ERAKGLKNELIGALELVGGIQFLAKKVDLDAAGIKDLSFGMGSEIDRLFLLLAAEDGDKAILSCYISKELVAEKGLDAAKIVRELGKFIQGGGGGQPFFATAGGKDPGGIALALEKARQYLSP